MRPPMRVSRPEQEPPVALPEPELFQEVTLLRLLAQQQEVLAVEEVRHEPVVELAEQEPVWEEPVVLAVAAVLQELVRQVQAELRVQCQPRLRFVEREEQVVPVRPLHHERRVEQVDPLPVQPPPLLSQPLVRPKRRELREVEHVDQEVPLQRHLVRLRRHRPVPLPVRPEPLPQVPPSLLALQLKLRRPVRAEPHLRPPLLQPKSPLLLLQ